MSRQMEENRGQYYERLNQAQKGDLDISDWVIWFADQFAASCQKSLKHIDVALEKARYWAAHSGDEFNERQMKVLKKLLDAGNGGFLGGLTREKYTKITGCSDATGTRDLVDLLQKGALASIGVGKGTKYFVNVLGWNGDTEPPQHS
jgi:Fic family protein